MSPNDQSFEEELKSAFLEEAAEILSEAEADFLRLETAADEELWEKISRVAHNLKGGARTAGLEKLADCMHALETVLQRLHKGESTLDAGAVGRLLAVRDRVFAEVVAARSGQRKEMALADVEATLKNWDSSPAELKGTDSANFESDSIRIEMKRIEKLVNDVGELVVLTNALRDAVENDVKAKPILDAWRATLRETQDLALSLRMIPARGLFRRAKRVAHDAAAKLGKICEVEISGEELEVDKLIVDRLSDPLMHLMNNAVDHGIAKQGKIFLSAQYRGNRVEIECRDDGRGIDETAVKKRALERGLIKSNQALSQRECFELLFAPGFSTAQTVSAISGRGVGLDVVRSAVESLGGTIGIESAPGKGTTFRLSLAMNLAILDAAVVEAEGVRWLVPMSHIEEVIAIENETKEIRHRGFAWKTVRLKGKERKSASRVALLVQGRQRWACLADEITGPQSVVVRPLGKELSRLPGITGGAVLPDGRPALVMDLPVWAESAGRPA